MEKFHIPTNLLSHSPSFQISHNANNTTSNDPLPLFSHVDLPKGGLTFIGGPVSSLTFHPSAPGICLTAAHNTTNPTHILHKCYEGPAVIQLWRFSLSLYSAPTTCLGLIPHNGDCTFDLKWRPEKVQNFNQKWSGTFAAALGDGSVIVCHLDVDHIPNVDILPQGSAPKLEPTTIVLRRNNARSPARVLEWSPDGKRLVVGSANGNVEIYEADSHDACWPSWTIPAQESVISDIRWFSPQLYCTLGMSCVLRLCDVRDPIATLEQNCEGLQGSLSMAMLEPNVAVVGADTGYLRVVRLSVIDQTTAQDPVRRVYLQTSSFRDMRTVSFSDMTVLYTGGSEGILHQVIFPKPLWPLKGSCKIENSRISEKLRWDMKDSVMRLQLNPPQPVVEKRKKKGSSVRRSTDGPEGALFGERYKQQIVITRIAVDAQNNIIAVGVDGGFVTWLSLNNTSGSHVTPVVEENAQMKSKTRIATNGRDRQSVETNGDSGLNPSSSLRNIPLKVKLKKEAKRPVYGPKRKRGRPRKTVTDNDLQTERRKKPAGDDTVFGADTVDTVGTADETDGASRRTVRHTAERQAEVETSPPAVQTSRAGKRRRSENGDDTAEASLEETVAEPIASSKRGKSKRRKMRVLDSAFTGEVTSEAKGARADEALEEAVFSQKTQNDNGAKATLASETTRAKTKSGPSSKREKARSGSRPQNVQSRRVWYSYPWKIPLRLRISHPEMVPVRLRVRKTAGETAPNFSAPDSGHKSTPGDSAQPPKSKRKGSRSRSNEEAPASDQPAQVDVSIRAEPSDGLASPEGSVGVTALTRSTSKRHSPVATVVDRRMESASDLSSKLISSNGTTDMHRSPSVKLLVRRRAPRKTPPSQPDVNATSGLIGGYAGIPLRLRVRKRRIGDANGPTGSGVSVPKRPMTEPRFTSRDTSAANSAVLAKGKARSMTIPQVLERVTHSDSVVESSVSRESDAQDRGAGPVRSKRRRKPSRRMRGE